MLWDVISRRLRTTPFKKTDPVPAVTFSPDGRNLAIGKRDNTVDLWDLALGKTSNITSPSSKGIPNCIHCLWYSPDGRMLAAGRNDSTVLVWQMVPGKTLEPINLKFGGGIRALTFSRDGKYIAARGSLTPIKVWKVDTWQEVGDLRKPTSMFPSLAFSPDGQSLAAGGKDNGISIFPWTRSSICHDDVIPRHDNDFTFPVQASR